MLSGTVLADVEVQYIVNTDYGEQELGCGYRYYYIDIVYFANLEGYIIISTSDGQGVLEEPPWPQVGDWYCDVDIYTLGGYGTATVDVEGRGVSILECKLGLIDTIIFRTDIDMSFSYP